MLNGRGSALHRERAGRRTGPAYLDSLEGAGENGDSDPRDPWRGGIVNRPGRREGEMWKWAALVVVVVGVAAGLVWGIVGKSTAGEYVEHTIQQKEVTQRRMAVPKIDQKIKSYLIEHGTYPESLDVLEGLPPAPPGFEYEYDPKQGTVYLLHTGRVDPGAGR
jgi:hypothetical protein